MKYVYIVFDDSGTGDTCVGMFANIKDAEIVADGRFILEQFVFESADEYLKAYGVETTVKTGG